MTPSHSTDHALPELAGLLRPRLRDDVPVLWRTSSSIQIGDAVTLHDVARSSVAWLTSLDGLRVTDQVLADLPLAAVEVPEAARLLRAALAAGALEDAACMPAALRWASLDQRPAGFARFGATLAACRDAARAIDITDARDQCRVRVQGAGDVAVAVRAAVADAGMTVADDGPFSVRVLANAPHPDIPEYSEPHSNPHLHIGVLADRACVGPLVVPGRTSCLRCAHLHHRDADPAWPVVSVQWAQAVRTMRHRPLDPVLTSLAALQAAVLLRSWIQQPDDVTAWSDTAVLLTLPDCVPRRVERPPHPLCGCRWLAA